MLYQPYKSPHDIDFLTNFIKDSFAKNGLPVIRCSQVLFSQLVHMPEYGGINYPFQFVEHEIKHLEGLGPSKTKLPTFFKNSKLKQFQHKHFYVPGYEHPARNAQESWKLNNPSSQKFTQMALKIAKQYANASTEAELREFSSKIADEFISGKGSLTDRLSNAKGTGDWIVFIRNNNENYYLCIAKHGEDDFILEAIKYCIIDFPFISLD